MLLDGLEVMGYSTWAWESEGLVPFCKRQDSGCACQGSFCESSRLTEGWHVVCVVGAAGGAIARCRSICVLRGHLPHSGWRKCGRIYFGEDACQAFALVKLRSHTDKRLGWVSDWSLWRRDYAVASGIMGSVSASLHGVVVPERVQKGPAADEAVPLDGLQAASHPT